MEIATVTSLSNISPKFKQLTVKGPSVLIYLNVLVNGKGKGKKWRIFQTQRTTQLINHHTTSVAFNDGRESSLR